MIKLINVDIQTSAFQIMDLENNGFDLTTAYKYYSNALKPLDGGVQVFPEFNINKNTNGKLLIRQICTFHKLDVLLNSGKINFTLSKANKDTVKEEDLNYSAFIIKNGSILDKHGLCKEPPIFSDSLQRQLHKHWMELDYSIKFTTSYSLEVNDKLYPIFEFDWEAGARCINNNKKWKLQSSYISTPSSIKKSIRKVGIKTIDTTNMDHLYSTVENHFKSNPMLKAN